MRLTIINQFYTPDLSPTAHLAASLAEHRAALGDVVRVVTSRGGYVSRSAAGLAERDGAVKVHRVWTPQLGKSNAIKRCIDYGVFYLGALLCLMTLPRQDLIISLTTPPYIIWTAIVHRLIHARRPKLILWNMDCYPELAERSDKLRENGFAASVMRAMNRSVFRRLDHLVCLDRAMVDLLNSQYAPPARAVPTTIIPNWEPASFFPREEMNPDGSTVPWTGVDEALLRDRFVVLYLGNAGYGHDFETALDAAAMLRNEAVVFLFVGGGSRWNAIERRVRERGLANVVMRGYVPKEVTRDVMRCAHCALITLRDRILGVMSPSKLHSNLAMGLPVIYVGPERSNVDDAIADHRCGVSVRHGDAQGVADYIRALQGNEARLAEAKDNARQAFEKAYCDTVALTQFDEVIARLG